MHALYLYGIARFPPALGTEVRGLGGSPVFLIAHGDLAGLISRSPLRSWAVNEPHLTRHEAVIEEVMACRPVLPARFNTLLKTEEAVETLLHERGRSLRSALDRVEGKVEMGLRVLWEPPAGVGIAPTMLQTRPAGPGTTYLSGKLLEERRRRQRRDAGEPLISHLQARFRRLAAESRIRRLPSDWLLLSAAYLVERDAVSAFRTGAETAAQEFPGLGFLVTGPWPPYHFVDEVNSETRDAFSA